MKLQAKSISLLLFSFFVMGLAIVLLANLILLKKFETIEEAAFAKELQELSAGLDYIKNQIPIKMSDWSNWDDSYHYMQTRDPAYLKSNFNPSLLGDIRLNLVSFWDNDGNLVFSYYASPRHEAPHALPPELAAYIARNKNIFIQKDPEKSLLGWIPTENGPMILSVVPILHTDHSGPVAGTMISGRHLDDVMAQALREVSHRLFTATALPAPAGSQPIRQTVEKAPTLRITHKTDQKLHGDILLYDLTGQPLLKLSTEEARTIYQQGKKTLEYFLIAIFILGSGTLLLSYFLLESQVVSRIRTLGRQVRGIQGNFHQQIDLPGSKQDEVYDLLSDINAMLSRLAESEQEKSTHLAVLKQSEEALNVAKTKAEAANTTKTEFLANMSHELRTPLNGVIGMCQLLSEEALTPEQQDMVSTIEVCGQNLLTLINEILDFSKIEAGKMELEKIVFNLDTWVDELCRVARQPVEGKGLAFQVRVTPTVPRRLKGDPYRLKQVVLNLLSNATKFTETGHVHLSIDTWDTGDPEKALVLISVEDTGIGISPENKQRIFEAFNQSDTSTSRKYGGTGLGLTISSRLMQMMGGELGVISEPGRGSVFWVHLFLETAKATEVTSDTSVTPSADISSTERNSLPPGLRVLLAEDNRVNQEVCLRMLEKVGVHADSVCNGRQAVEKIKAQPYDVILMDCQMPEMDGYQATAAIRQLPAPLCNLPIIALTAHAMEGDRDKCLAAGMNDYLAKPLHQRQLLETLAQWAPISEAV